MNALQILAAHQLTGATTFSHHNGQCMVDYPKCGCGEQMHPNRHPQHLLDILTAAGYTTLGQASETP